MHIHGMKLLSTLTVILGSMTGTGSAQGTELWDRAVKVVEGSAGYAPGHIVTEMHMTDKKGEPTQTTLMEMTVSQGEDGAIKQEIVRMITDGEDQTEKAKAEMAKKEVAAEKDDENSGTMSVSVGGHAWDPDKQSKITVTALPEMREIQARPVKGFQFEDRSHAEKTTTGTAWIDPETGFPVEAVFSEEPLPTGVKEMIITARYGVKDGIWQLLEMETKGSAGFLVFKRNFVSTMKFDNYFKVIPTQQVPPA